MIFSEPHRKHPAMLFHIAVQLIPLFTSKLKFKIFTCSRAQTYSIALFTEGPPMSPGLASAQSLIVLFFVFLT